MEAEPEPRWHGPAGPCSGDGYEESQQEAIQQPPLLDMCDYAANIINCSNIDGHNDGHNDGHTTVTCSKKKRNRRNVHKSDILSLSDDEVKQTP